MSLVHNERWKLTATWLNTLASAIVVVGCFTPAAAIAYGLGTTSRNIGFVLLLGLVCLGVGGALHLAARRMLGRLVP